MEFLEKQGVRYFFNDMYYTTILPKPQFFNSFFRISCSPLKGSMEFRGKQGVRARERARARVRVRVRVVVVVVVVVCVRAGGNAKVWVCVWV